MGVNKVWHIKWRQDQNHPPSLRLNEASHHWEYVPKSHLMRRKCVGVILYMLVYALCAYLVAMVVFLNAFLDGC